MSGFWLGVVGVVLILWVFRIPITLWSCYWGWYICDKYDWEDGVIFFGRIVNSCFYYYPEWFPNLISKEDEEEWRRWIEEEKL